MLVVFLPSEQTKFGTEGSPNASLGAFACSSPLHFLRNFWLAAAGLSTPLRCTHPKQEPGSATPSFSLPIGVCKQEGANKPFLGNPPQQVGTL